MFEWFQWGLRRREFLWFFPVEGSAHLFAEKFYFSEMCFKHLRVSVSKRRRSREEVVDDLTEKRSFSANRATSRISPFDCLLIFGNEFD